MTDEEEINIILKRLPSQIDYVLSKKEDLEFDLMFVIPTFSLTENYVIVKRKKERARLLLLLDSSEGVLQNLITRLDELLKKKYTNLIIED